MNSAIKSLILFNQTKTHWFVHIVSLIKKKNYLLCIVCCVKYKIWYPVNNTWNLSSSWESKMYNAVYDIFARGTLCKEITED